MTLDARVNEDLRAYYSRRVREYERVYAKTERQGDLAILRACLPTLLAGRKVLEVACGTGYWTQPVACRARSICAVDASPEVLDFARLKFYQHHNVDFVQGDAYVLDGVASDCDAGLAAFWISHVPCERLSDFLGRFHARLDAGARCVLLDNRYVAGSSTPIHRTDAHANTYQLRQLRDGSVHDVLKNFPDEESLRQVLGAWSTDIEYVALDYYWYVVYQLG